MSRTKSFFKTLLLCFLLLGSSSCSDNVTGQGTSLGLDCDVLDLFDPILDSSLVQTLPAALTRSPEYTWDPASDFCGVENYEYSIGTTVGGEEIVAWTPIGTNTTFRAENLSLLDGVTYYFSLRAADAAGNLSAALHSAGWEKLDPISDLPNMILRLNGFELNSVIDNNGLTANNGGFNNNVQQWLDTSGGINTHNWFATGAANRPLFLPAENALQFNGASQFLTVNNHTDLNTGTVDQRNFTVAFETGNNITNRQVIYEEGGSVRGMNVYIQNGNIYCGFYNTNNDGDGAQPFVSVNAPITTNTRYSVTWVFDYLNYAGSAGPNGSLTCYLSGTQIGQTFSTSLLYAHSGALGLGAKYNDSYYHSGASNGNGDYFSGKIMEVMIIESVPTPDQLILINEYLTDKWQM